MAAKGKEDPHFRRTEERKAEKVPVISMDYAFMSKEDQIGKTKVIVIKDNKSKAIFTHVVSVKGASDPWIVKKIVEDIDSLGYKAAILQCDNENSILEVRNEVKKMRIEDTMTRKSATGDSQTNGSVERGVQSAEGQIRAMIMALEKRLQCPVDPDWCALHWLIELAGIYLTRYEKGHDGMTPYRRRTGKDWDQAILEFGEKILYKPLAPKSTSKEIKNKMEPRFIEGVWLGITTDGKEHVVGPSEGVVRARTVKRRPYSERWSIEDVKSIKGIPARPNPEDGSTTIPIRIRIQGDILEETPPEGHEPVRRRLMLQKKDFGKHGFTEGCQGCRQVEQGGYARDHNPTCRKRMEELIAKTDKGRVKIEKANERINQQVAE